LKRFINRRQLSDLRGVVRLAMDATLGVTDLVEKMHHTIQLGHPPLGASRASNTSGLTGFVYRSIRGTTRLVGHGLDAGMAPVTALLPEGESAVTRDAFVSVINGVYGDHLVQTDNPLAIKMGLYHRGLLLNLEKQDIGPGIAGQAAQTGKVLIFVHGLCLNEGHWTHDGVNHGEALALKLGYTPLYLRYNTGLPVADNGMALAAMLENFLRSWPHCLTELVVVGHSMGGLVARSASHHGKLADHDWLRQLRSLVFIGTPHHGAPLERSGNWLANAMGLSPYAVPFTGFARMRSAGITDLRHGSITNKKQDCVPLPTDVECYAVAATLADKRSQIHESLIGDGLVPVDSALGLNKDPKRTLLIPEDHQWVGYDMGHIGLLGSTRVYEQLYSWLS